MRKSGSAVLLLLGYANSVDAMSRVRRGDMGWGKIGARAWGGSFTGGISGRPVPSCPQDCNGRGTCNNGVCICNSGKSVGKLNFNILFHSIVEIIFRMVWSRLPK